MYKLPFLPDPVRTLQVLAEEPPVVFLDSSDGSGWSYIGVFPSRLWHGRTLEDWKRFKVEARGLVKPGRNDSPVPFSSGLMGMLSYDLGMLLEGVVSRHPDMVPGGSLFSFGFYENVLAFAPGNAGAFLCGGRDNRAWDALESAARASCQAGRSDGPGQPPGPGSSGSIQSDFSKDEYCRMVHQALELIRSGDIYEVNGSRRFSGAVGVSAGSRTAWYSRLRAESPVPYGCFYCDGEWTVAGSSPELFLALTQGRAVTRPMKGTRPRGRSLDEDRSFYHELESSVKERAELLMVTDLLRNDFGKVCAQGSIRVTELRAIERYRRVFQAVSQVEGQLKAGADAFDLIEASFPGGSVTGCPKHRAVQVIDELERSRRGYYTGAMGYLSAGGDLKLNILIRSIFFHGERAYFSAGGGIVADSDPGSEFEETGLKAQGMIRAILGEG